MPSNQQNCLSFHISIQSQKSYFIQHKNKVRHQYSATSNTIVWSYSYCLSVSFVDYYSISALTQCSCLRPQPFQLLAGLSGQQTQNHQCFWVVSFFCHICRDAYVCSSVLLSKNRIKDYVQLCSVTHTCFIRERKKWSKNPTFPELESFT